jgi:hypothetical protein
MRKQLLSIALWSGVLYMPVYATAGTWNFHYQGFQNYSTGEFEAGRTLDGSFEAEDLNHDNVITRDELSTFTVDGITYSLPDADLHQFSYSTTGQLYFFATDAWYDEEFRIGVQSAYSAGDFYAATFSAPWGSWTDAYLWTDQTVFTITPPPVPEPGAALLLPAGLAVLAAVRRGRRTLAR